MLTHINNEDTRLIVVGLISSGNVLHACSGRFEEAGDMVVKLRFSCVVTFNLVLYIFENFLRVGLYNDALWL